MKIVALDGYTKGVTDNPWDEVAALGDLAVHDRTAPEEVIPRCREADIVLTDAVALPAETIAALPGLRLICVMAAGYDGVDVAEAGRRGIPVVNAPGYGPWSVAQFAIALLLELCHRVGLHDEAVKGGEWRACPDYCFWKSPQVELHGKVFGVVGFGNIGSRAARMAHGLGMEVIAYTPRPKPAPDFAPFAFVDLPDLFSRADVVSLHCPLTAENRGFLGEALLSRMKPTAFLVNTARGKLVVEADLAAALNGGRIAGAALDVVSVEPIRPDNPLLSARNCLITPHIAWSTLEARRRLMHLTAENIRAWLAGSPVNVVNRAWLDAPGGARD